MADQVEVTKGRDGKPVVIVRLRFEYSNIAENLLAAVREIQKEIVRLEYRRDI